MKTILIWLPSVNEGSLDLTLHSCCPGKREARAEREEQIALEGGSNRRKKGSVAVRSASRVPMNSIGFVIWKTKIRGAANKGRQTERSQCSKPMHWSELPM